jgi:hypothetical protein
MAWDSASGQFPAVAPISMSQLFTGFNLQVGPPPLTYPFSLKSLIGRTLYDNAGNSYIIPSGQLNLTYFLGKYFLDTGPVSQTYTSETIIPPVNPGKPKITRFVATAIGGGAGGGGGGGGYGCAGPSSNRNGGGGGGGGSGKTSAATPYTYVPGTSITATIGAGGAVNSGGRHSQCANYDGSSGDSGNAGGTTTFTYGSYPAITGEGGLSPNGGTAAGYNSGAVQEQNGSGGAGAGGGADGGGSGNSDGGAGGPQINSAGGGGRGGDGGRGRNADGAGGAAGGGGGVYITWYFT